MVTTAFSSTYAGATFALKSSVNPFDEPMLELNPTSLNSLDHTIIESVSPDPVKVAEALVCEGLTT
jgi:hypothetical protein